jgi:hypothetical protein
MRTESLFSKVLAVVLAGVVVFLLVRSQIRIHDDEDDAEAQRPLITTQENPSPVRQADYKENQK